MLEDAALWLEGVAPGLDLYELTALNMGAMVLTGLLLLISLLALARAARLLSDTQAIALKTSNLEAQTLRLSADVDGLRDRLQISHAEPRPRPVSATGKGRRVTKSRTPSAYAMRRAGDGRGEYGPH